MSRYSQLVFVLSLAACEHHSSQRAPLAPTSEPSSAEPAPAPESKPALAPIEEVATPTPPAPSPVKPAVVVKQPVSARPCSRAGCRWDEESDEREVQRLRIKKESCERPTRAACDWTKDDEARLDALLIRKSVKP